jgi:hypothetical protein
MSMASAFWVAAGFDSGSDAGRTVAVSAWPGLQPGQPSNEEFFFVLEGIVAAAAFPAAAGA